MQTKSRFDKYKKLRHYHPIKTTLRYFIEGYIDHTKGANFSMTPYPASPSPSSSYDNDRFKRKGWSRGYWAAERIAKRRRAQ